MAASADDERLALLAQLNRSFAEVVPHNKELGMVITHLGAGVATMQLPWDARLVGDPETGVLHGGVVTSLLDACSGAAVFMALAEPVPIATLDLRIDYLRPADPRVAVQAHAHCFKVTRSIAFVRSVAHHGSVDDPIATGTGTFMVRTRVAGSRRRRGGEPPGAGAGRDEPSGDAEGGA